MSDTSLPSIRPSQQDGLTRGIIKNSVNLFRGTVIQSQTFFTMPGRNEEDGLSVSISAVYEGGRQNHADLNNIESPTGVLGLGWKLNLTCISVDPVFEWPESIRRYILHMDGHDFPLIREPVVRELFSCPASLWAGQASQTAVLDEVADLFHKNGAILSASAVIEAEGAERFRLYDDRLEQAYVAELKGDLIFVRFDGESYQTAPYQFWQITYIPRYERWTIIREDGSVSGFGGGVHSVAGTDYKASEGNSIVWRVSWTDEAGVSIWSGSGTPSENQKQYASRWYQNRIYSRYGEYVSISYNEFERDANGLLIGVEQLVTVGGLPYTKACYMTGITDVFGRKAFLRYKEKTWKDISECDIREYGSNHACNPECGPNGYQDYCETMYLHEIAVSEPDGTPLMGVTFDYGDGPQVLSGNSGDFAKRFLTGYDIVSSTGDRLAGNRFEYITDPNEKEITGALKKVIWPTGGEAEYSYGKLSLDSCQRSGTLKPPADMPEDSHPAVWNSGNSAAVIWHHSGSGKLALQIATWYGQWCIWSPDESSSLLYEGDGFNLQSLNVMFGADFIAVSYETDKNTFLHLYRKDPKNPCGWIAATSRLKPEKPGLPAPFCSWDNGEGKVRVQGGSNFFLACQMKASDYTRTFDIYTWNWISGQWEKRQERRENHVVLSTASSSYVEVDAEGNAYYHYLDQLQQWHTSQTKLPCTCSGINQLALSSSDQFAALTRLLSSPRENVQRYELYLLRWNGNGAFLPHQKFTLLHKNPGVSWSPTIVSDCMAAVAGHLVRFNGKEWILNSALCPQNAGKTDVIRYAYGPDYGIAVRTQSGPVKAQFMSFEPESGWLAQPVSIEGLTTPDLHSNTANHPVSGGDNMFVIGSRVFYRDFGQSWKNALFSSNSVCLEDQMKLSDPSHHYLVNSSAISIQVPGFLVCAMYDLDHAYGKREDIVAVFPLKNGKLYGAPQILSNRRIWSPDELNLIRRANYPFGLMSFATYPDAFDKMNDGNEIGLHHFAAGSIDGPVMDYPVQGITVNDGLDGISKTTCCPDGSTASVSQDGEYVKYYKTVCYPDGTPEYCPHGSVETHFLNTNSPEFKSQADYCWMLDGLTSCVTNKDSKGNTVSSEETVWEIHTTVALEPDASAAKPVYSAYVLPSQTIVFKDDLTNTVAYYYTLNERKHIYHGQPVRISSETQTLKGVEKQTRELNYICEVYEAARRRHMLTPICQALTSVNGIPTVIQALTYRLWPSCYPDKAVVLDQEGEFFWKRGTRQFPFGNPQKPSAIPQNWLCKAMVQERTEEGQSLLVTYPAGATGVGRYSETYALPVLKIEGALKDECVWNSFFTYDKQPDWFLSGSTGWTQDAWFGDQSLLLNSGGRIQTQILPCSGRTKYVAGIRYRSNLDANDIAALITLSEGEKTHTIMLSGTCGEWKFLTDPVDVWPNCNTLQLELFNQSKSSIIVDTIFALPAESNIQAQFWRPGSHSLISVMDIAGRVKRTVYDHFTRPIGEALPDGSLKELEFFHTYAQDGLYCNQHLTNMEVKLRAAGVNRIENFYDKESWRLRWKPDADAAWITENRMLQKPGQEADGLSWIGAQDGQKRISLYAEMVFKDGQEISPSLTFGDGFRIGWQKSEGWELTDKNGQTLQKPLWSSGRPSGHWLITLDQEMLLFFFNGRLIFSLREQWDISSEIKIHTGDGPIQIHNLFAGADTRLVVVHRDGLDQERQLHRMLDNDTLISEWIYDGMGNVTVMTRPIPGSFGKGMQVPPFAWHEGFVNRSAFLNSHNNPEPAMEGDVADYYRGQDGRVDDGGYPYWSRTCEPSPLQRVLRTSDPGTGERSRPDLNIRTQQYSTQYKYHAGEPEAIVPAGRFHVNTMIVPDGSSMHLYKDTLDRQTAQIIWDRERKRSNCTTYEYSYGGKDEETYSLATQYLPNFFSGAELESSQARMVYTNSLNQVTSWKDCDTGITKFITDGLGNKRFIKTPLYEETNQFLYYAYDRLGRVIEEGTLYGTWNKEVLQRLAEKPGTQGFTGRREVLRRYQYGDGKHPLSTGMLVSVITFNRIPQLEKNQSDVTVTESITYNENGKVASLLLATEGLRNMEDFVGEVAYQYNGLGQLSQIKYPDGGAIRNIFYTYNDLDKVTCIRTPMFVRPIASYTWTEEGLISSMAREGIEEKWSYTSSGRVKSHTAHQLERKEETVFCQEVWYNSLGMPGKRATKTAFYKKEEDFEYDYLSRLTGSKSIEGNTEIRKRLTYDDNGNMLQYSRNDSFLKAFLEEGTNRLKSALVKDRELEFQYGKNGSPTNWRGIRCGYDACGTLLNVLDTGKDTIRFIRGSKDEPLIRMTSSSLNLQYCGDDNVPLFSWDGQDITLYIPGPDTMAAAFGEDGVRYPISDVAGTVWAVADQNGYLTAAYDYEPFGVASKWYGPECEKWPFLFQGKQWIPEVSLYSFGTRLYDPILKRFITPDPARQFASSYVFLGNNPLILVDPSGNITKEGKIFAVAGFILLAAIGVAVSIFSFGASALIYTVAGGIVGGAITGMGLSGAVYCATTSVADFKKSELGKAVWQGAVSGAISGAVSSYFGAALNMSLQGAASSTIIMSNMISGAFTGGATGILTTGVSTLINGTPVNGIDFLKAAAIGCATGLITGFLSGVKGCTLSDAVTTGANKLTQSMINVSSKANAVVDGMKTLPGFEKGFMAVSAVFTVYGFTAIAASEMELANFPEQQCAKQLKKSYLSLSPS